MRVYSATDNYGTYKFRIWVVPDPEAFDYSIGDTVSNAVPQPGAGYVESPGAEDVYSFTVSSGGLDVLFDWQSRFNNLKTQLIYPDGSTVTGCTDRFLTLPEGDYTLRVYSATDSYGTYKVRITEQERMAGL